MKNNEQNQFIEKDNLEYKIREIARPYLAIHKLMENIPQEKWQEYYNKTSPLVKSLYFNLCIACDKAKKSGLFREEEISELNDILHDYKKLESWIKKHMGFLSEIDEKSPNYYF